MIFHASVPYLLREEPRLPEPPGEPPGHLPEDRPTLLWMQERRLPVFLTRMPQVDFGGTTLRDGIFVVGNHNLRCAFPRNSGTLSSERTSDSRPGRVAAGSIGVKRTRLRGSWDTLTGPDDGPGTAGALKALHPDRPDRRERLTVHSASRGGRNSASRNPRANRRDTFRRIACSGPVKLNQLASPR